jgi:hypothetical protein
MGGLRVSCPANLIVIHIGQTQNLHNSNLLLQNSRIYLSAGLGSEFCVKVPLFLEISHVLVHSLSVCTAKKVTDFSKLDIGCRHCVLPSLSGNQNRELLNFTERANCSKDLSVAWNIDVVSAYLFHINGH